jgi:hypothetical protein
MSIGLAAFASTTPSVPFHLIGMSSDMIRSRGHALCYRTALLAHGRCAARPFWWTAPVSHRITNALPHAAQGSRPGPVPHHSRVSNGLRLVSTVDVATCRVDLRRKGAPETEELLHHLGSRRPRAVGGRSPGVSCEGRPTSDRLRPDTEPTPLLGTPPPPLAY